MLEPEIPESVHDSHIMGVEINKHTGRLYDVCTVCHECSCHSKSALIKTCDDISWAFKL